MRYLILLAMLIGCTSPVEPSIYAITPDAVRADCGPDEGLLIGANGAIVRGITQCALCARFEAAYETRAAELGCAPFPSGACVDEGLEDCLVALVDEWADFSWALDCEQLEAFAAQPSTYAGFVCGDSCVTTGTGREECCPGTPYELRGWESCPFWCDGLSQCGGIPACEALLEERGGR